MRKLLSFGGDLFWLMVSVFFALAVGLFLLHVVRSHAPGIVGNVAGGIESAITPQG